MIINMRKTIQAVAILIFVLVTISITLFIASKITKEIIAKVMREKMENSVLADKTTQAGFDQIVDDNFKIIISGIFKRPRIENSHEVTWAGHVFEVGQLRTSQYKSDGVVEFMNDGFKAGGYSLPRTTLLDVNLNQKIKVKIKADFEGGLDGSIANSNEDCLGFCITTERYHFSEFAIYAIDEDGNKQGLRVLGTRHNIIEGNSRKNFAFTELTIENTGERIIVTDNTGVKVSFTKDLNYVMGEGENDIYVGADYGEMNQNQKWLLGINNHVNGEGFSKLRIKEIQVVK